jgi:hypothetical protein
MKYFTMIILILFIGFGSSFAQYKPASSLLIFNAGWTSATPEDIDADLSGNTFSLSWEQTDLGGIWSCGFAMAYSKTSADSLNADGSKVKRINKVSYEVVPVTFFAKAMFGSDVLRGYVGAGLGIQFSNINYFAERGQITAYESGFSVSGTAGGYFFISESVLLNANYSLTYLGNSFYQDGLAHNINIGLGFQFD